MDMEWFRMGFLLLLVSIALLCGQDGWPVIIIQDHGTVRGNAYIAHDVSPVELLSKSRLRMHSDKI
jgi:hypothetical protein